MIAAPVAIRPADPCVVGPTLAYAPYSSSEAVRRILDLACRDCHTALDLTFGGGNFWRTPLPPGLALTTNNPAGGADLALDFTATGLPDRAYDVVIYDPPHLADGGTGGIMASRYGTVKGTDGLRALIEAGAREAARVARIAVVAKVADHSHGGRWLQLSRWVEDALGVAPYFVLHTYRTAPLIDGKWTTQRAPRCNGAVWPVARMDGRGHRDWRTA